MGAYRMASLDEIASQKWPYWIPVRHHFAIETFGMNVWRGREDGSLIPEHDEADSGAPELYWVVSGGANFTVAGETIEAPAGTMLWVEDASAKRSAVATGPDTLVASIGAAAPGGHYSPSGWDSHYLEGE